MNEIIAPESCKIVRLHGRDGNYKLTNNEVVTVLLKESNTQLKIKAHSKGIITFKCKEGDEVNENDVLCVMSPCQHDIVICGICGLCCAPIEITNMGNGDIKCNIGSRMAMVHNNKDLVVNERTAMELALKDSVNLLKKRKLSLLIDLDLTILHTTSNPVSPDLADVYNYTLRDDRGRHESINYHTKMRPHLKEFLENMHTKFELHIYTFGNRSYAEKIREFIDPQKTLFGQRVISRDDSFDVQKKTANLRSLFPRGDNMVVIVDDRPEVWSHAPNLIHVRPFLFFQDAGDINSPPGSGGGGRDPRDGGEAPPQTGGGPEDDYLPRLQTILEEIHARYFQEVDRLQEPPEEVVRRGVLPDVKAVMRARRAEVLRGCRVAFSGLVPLRQAARDTPAFKVLRALGGRYHPSLVLPQAGEDPRTCTSHLICHSDGTRKVREAARYIREVNEAGDEEAAAVSMVTVYWLWHCHFLWARVPEEDFLLLAGVCQARAGGGPSPGEEGASPGGKRARIGPLDDEDDPEGSDGGSGGSSFDGDAFLACGRFLCSDQQREEMMREVDEALEEDGDEDEEAQGQAGPCGGEDDDEDEEGREWDYGHFEEDYRRFGGRDDGDDSEGDFGLGEEEDLD